jgi:hypothetical protein
MGLVQAWHTFGREALNSGGIKYSVPVIGFPYYTLLASNSLYDVGFEWDTSVRPNETHEIRMYCQFDTSTIPNDATILQVDYEWNVYATHGASIGWQIRFLIGTWIGAALDTGDWHSFTGYESTYTYGGIPSGNYRITPSLQASVINKINKTGMTDLRYRDTSVRAATTDLWQTLRWTSIYARLHCLLEYEHRSHKVAWTP